METGTTDLAVVCVHAHANGWLCNPYKIFMPWERFGSGTDDDAGLDRECVAVCTNRHSLDELTLCLTKTPGFQDGYIKYTVEWMDYAAWAGNWIFEWQRGWETVFEFDRFHPTTTSAHCYSAQRRSTAYRTWSFDELKENISCYTAEYSVARTARYQMESGHAT